MALGRAKTWVILLLTLLLASTPGRLFGQAMVFVWASPASEHVPMEDDDKAEEKGKEASWVSHRSARRKAVPTTQGLRQLCLSPGQLIHLTGASAHPTSHGPLAVPLRC
jgi:hypothetical protein